MASRSEKERIVLEEIRKLKDQINAATQADEAALKAKLELYEEQLDALRSSLEYLNEQIQLADKLAKQYNKVAEANKGNADIQLTAWEQQKLVHRKRIDFLGEEAKKLDANDKIQKGILEKNMKEVKNHEREIANLDTKIKRTEEWHATIEEAVATSRDLGKSLGKAMAMPQTHDFVGNIQSITKGLQGTGASMRAFGNAAASAISAQFVNNIIGMAVAIVDMEAGFQRATGASAEFATVVRESYNETKKFAVTAEEASKSAQALFTSYTDFTFMSRDSQKTLIKSTNILAKQGIAVGDLAKATQISTKMLGVNAEHAAGVNEEIATFARELGVAPAQMAAEFAKGGAALAKFGDQGVQAFKDLQHISKITGMEMDKVLQITNKFDTFEGAAEQAGKLNAALGGNFVNAMDLMMGTNPAERFETIRNTILDAGLSFDTMSYYQKNFYKDALGLSDVGDLALILSGNMNMVSGATQKSAEDYEVMADRALKMQSIQDKLNAAIAESTDLIDWLVDSIKWLTDHVDEFAGWAKYAMYAMLGWKLATIALGLAQVVTTWRLGTATAATVTNTAVEELNIAAKNLSTTSSNLLNVSLKKQAVGSEMASKGGKSLATTMVAIGLAALGIGAGVYFAATGVADLAAAFNGLGWAAIPAAIAIGVFTLAFMVMIVSLIALVAGPQAALTTAAIGVMLSIGLAAAMIGAGVGVAALGLSILVGSFKDLGSAAMPAAAGLIAFSIAFAVMMLALTSATAGPQALLIGAAVGILLSIGAAALAIGYGIKLATDGMSRFNESLVSLASIEGTDNITTIMEKFKSALELLPEESTLITALNTLSKINFTTQIRQIAALSAAINSVRTDEALAFTSAIKAVTESVITVKNTPSPALAQLGGTGGTTGPTNLVANVYLDVVAMEDLIKNGAVEAVGDIVQDLM